MPSVSKIASHAGVSKSTVSLVLNDKEGVSASMRQRVKQAVEELKAQIKKIIKNSNFLKWEKYIME